MDEFLSNLCPPPENDNKNYGIGAKLTGYFSDAEEQKGNDPNPLEEDHIFAHYCQHLYTHDSCPTKPSIKYEVFKEQFLADQSQKKLYNHNIKINFAKEEYEIKVAKFKEEETFINPILFVKKIVEKLQPKTGMHVDINNIFIYDKDDTIVRVAKNNLEMNDQQEQEKDEQNYSSINREKNVKIDVKLQPFKVFFAQPWEQDKYQRLFDESTTFNDSQIRTELRS